MKLVNIIQCKTTVQNKNSIAPVQSCHSQINVYILKTEYYKLLSKIFKMYAI
jgi:hypothetical protein